MSVPYYGDFPEDATVRIPFNTFSSDDPSASVTITNLVDADIMVHKDGGTTQIATDGATVSIDFDAITGNHYIVVDTSAHADYATGSEYAVRIEGTTVDAGTINAWVGSFSIERSGGALALLKNGTYGLSALDADLGTLLTRVAQTLNLTASGNIGVDWANVENPTTALDLSQTDIQLVDTCTTNTDMVTEPPTATAIVDEWETQSQADPTGFHVNLKEIDGNAALVLRLKEFIDANVLFSDTAQAGGASTITLAAGTSVSDDDLEDYAIYLNGGTGSGQFARIDSVVAATQVATINTPNNGWVTNPDATTTYVILSAGSILHISAIHQAALTEITTELTANLGHATETKQDATDIVIAELTTQGDTNETKIDAIPTAVENRQEMDSNSTQLNTTLPALIDDLAVKKNATFSNFEFLMVLTSDHVTPAPGLTVTGQRSIDGGAFAGVSGAIAEVSNGIYQFDAVAADTNGDVITWRFSSATADDTFVTFKTVA